MVQSLILRRLISVLFVLLAGYLLLSFYFAATKTQDYPVVNFLDIVFPLLVVFVFPAVYLIILSLKLLFGWSIKKISGWYLILFGLSLGFAVSTFFSLHGFERAVAFAFISVFPILAGSNLATKGKIL